MKLVNTLYPIVGQGVEGMARVDVDLGTREYAIHIGSGVLQNLANAMQTLPTGRRLLLVTNPVVQKLFGKTLQDAFEGVGYEVIVTDHSGAGGEGFLHDLFQKIGVLVLLQFIQVV